MKAKFGAIVVDGRGKLNGHVASKNKAGSYFRGKVTPANPQTAAQSEKRGIVSTLSKAWSSLTDSQRANWNSAVSAYAKTDVFGDLRNPSGFNLFMKLNATLLGMGTAQIDTPPIPSAVGSIGSFTIVADNSSNTLVATLPDLDLETGDVFVEATPALSAGKGFVNSEFRGLGYMAAAASPLSLTALYIAKFGAVGAAGQKIHVRISPVNGTTGQKGAGTIAGTAIVA